MVRSLPLRLLYHFTWLCTTIILPKFYTPCAKISFLIQKNSFRDVSKKLDESPQPRFTPSVSSADSFLNEEALLGAYPPKIKRNSAASHALTAEFSFNMQPVFR